MHALAQNRIDRSDECWNDASIVEISKANRLKLYFDSAFLGLIGVLYQADSPIFKNGIEPDVEKVFQDSLQFLKINEADVSIGLRLSEVVFQFNHEAFDSLDLESTREWAYRVRRHVLAAQLADFVRKEI